MAKAENPQYIIKNATALYPRIDRTYRFDNADNRSVPCDPLDDGAEYSMKFKVPQAQAKEMFAQMKALYNEAKQDNWPDFKNPFKKEEDGNYSYKTSLKGAYGKEKTKKPSQFDAKVNPLPDNFQLTTGSVVNIAVQLVPYSTALANGVSLRLRSVQVVELAERQERNPFEAVDGFEANEGNPFTAVTSAPAPVEVDGFDEPEEEPAPKKRAAKKTEPKPESNDLADVLDAWSDED